MSTLCQFRTLVQWREGISLSATKGLRTRQLLLQELAASPGKFQALALQTRRDANRVKSSAERAQETAAAPLCLQNVPGGCWAMDCEQVLPYLASITYIGTHRRAANTEESSIAPHKALQRPCWLILRVRLQNFWVAVKEFKLSYHNPETVLFTICP